MKIKREIKFRGKRIDNGEWVCGVPVVTSISGAYMVSAKAKSKGGKSGIVVRDVVVQHEVDPATIGQYTGLKDKNGTEIYEGDIVTACWYDYEEPSHDTTGIVEFTNGWMGYWIADYDKKEFSELNGDGYYSWTIHIIGNIHDNPELLTD